ncbi:MAG TPA: double zinc ribbon domain-containing protein [Actinomycetota bacterium]
MLGRALDVVFPRRCAGCGGGAWPFCARCRDAVVPIAPPWCARCGHPWPEPVDACPACPPPPVATARAPFAYVGPVTAAVRRLKFAGWRDVAPALAAAVVVLGLPPVDAITWVPLARDRRAERGYDQARALAVAIGRETGTPVTRLARRTVRTGAQARRDARERREAMRGAFAAVTRPPARVLLVDDVLTTGATVAACAEALVTAGAGTVHVAAAARSVRRDALRPSGGRAYPRVGPRPGLWLPGDPPR